MSCFYTTSFYTTSNACALQLLVLLLLLHEEEDEEERGLELWAAAFRYTMIVKNQSYWLKFRCSTKQWFQVPSLIIIL